jgi:hypothetical protein
VSDAGLWWPSGHATKHLFCRPGIPHVDANLEGERGGHKDPFGASGALGSVEGNVHKNARIWGALIRKERTERRRRP